MRRHAVSHGISAVSVRDATKVQLVRMLSQHYIEAHGIQVVQGLIVDDASPAGGEENWQRRKRKLDEKLAKLTVKKETDAEKVAALEEEHGIKIPDAKTEGDCPLCSKKARIKRPITQPKRVLGSSFANYFCVAEYQVPPCAHYVNARSQTEV